MTPETSRWICLDVGETLIDETRLWSIWADTLEIPRLTFMAAFGAAIERGLEHRDVFTIVGRPDWHKDIPRVMSEYGGFASEDLYPDALTSLEALRAAGYRLAILANQPVERTVELERVGVEADVMAMSDELGVHKPDPAFYTRALELMGSPPPADVAYVGDRIDNDVVPSASAGMRAVWLRRGPWGIIPDHAPSEATMTIDGLAELVRRIDEAWA